MTFYNFFTNLNTVCFDIGLNNWFRPTAFIQPIPFNFNLQFPIFNFNYTPMLEKWSTSSNDFIDYSFSFSSNNSQTKSSGNYRSNSCNYTHKVSGNINNGYSHLSKSAAYQKALSDSSLENLSGGGQRWQISAASFRTDIPFAKKGTGKILDEVASNIGCNLVVTSALGTGQAGNPHQKGGYASHHNANNPKLDLRIPTGMSSSAFAEKLRSTGYFSHILNEGDHIDVQIDPAKYNSLNALA